MADSGANTLSSRYADIDKAYREQRWATVLEQGELLLREMGAAGESAVPGLRERIQLLMAHTHLYGYGDPDAAEDLYGTVLTSKAEASLRQIAEQGMQRCELPLERKPGEKAAEQRRARASARQRTASSSAIPEEARPVPIAPELESPALEAPAPNSRDLNSTDLDHQGPQSSTPESKDPDSLDQESAKPESLAQESQGPKPGSGLPAFLVGLASAQAAEAPAAGLEGGGQPALPWLQGSAAGAGTDATTGAPEGPFPPKAEKAIAAQQASSSAGEGSSSSPAPTLVPDVVEEPELIEVHQADPLLAEEVELTLTPPPRDITRQAARVSSRPTPQIEEDPELLAGLLDVTIG